MHLKTSTIKLPLHTWNWKRSILFWIKKTEREKRKNVTFKIYFSKHTTIKTTIKSNITIKKLKASTSEILKNPKWDCWIAFKLHDNWANSEQKRIFIYFFNLQMEKKIKRKMKLRKKLLKGEFCEMKRQLL